jgi:hypothetical protein
MHNRWLYPRTQYLGLRGRIFFPNLYIHCKLGVFPNRYRNPGPNRNLTLGPDPNPNPDPNNNTNPNPNPAINPLFTFFIVLNGFLLYNYNQWQNCAKF